jgi:hypothetical protein
LHHPLTLLNQSYFNCKQFQTIGATGKERILEVERLIKLQVKRIIFYLYRHFFFNPLHMLSLLTILYTIKTNETNLLDAINYIKQQSFKQQQFEDFVEKLKQIQSTQAITLLDLIIQHEQDITIMDQSADESLTYIQALHKPRLSKSSSFTTANIQQLIMDQDHDTQTSTTSQPSTITGFMTTGNAGYNLLSSSNQSASQSTNNTNTTNTNNNRRVNFLDTTNPAITSQMRTDMQGIDALATLLQNTLQTSFHNKPAAHRPFTPDEVNNMPVRGYADTLRNNYITAPKLSERDIHQIRFILAIYDDREIFTFIKVDK